MILNWPLLLIACERSTINTLRDRIKEPRRFIQVVMGPRQVGKTTMVIQLLGELKMESLFESADAIPASDSVWIEQIRNSARLKMAQNNEDEFLEYS